MSRMIIFLQLRLLQDICQKGISSGKNASTHQMVNMVQMVSVSWMQDICRIILSGM